MTTEEIANNLAKRIAEHSKKCPICWHALTTHQIRRVCSKFAGEMEQLLSLKRQEHEQEKTKVQ